LSLIVVTLPDTPCAYDTQAHRKPLMCGDVVGVAKNKIKFQA